MGKEVSITGRAKSMWNGQKCESAYMVGALLTMWWAIDYFGAKYKIREGLEMSLDM